MTVMGVHYRMYFPTGRRSGFTVRVGWVGILVLWYLWAAYVLLVMAVVAVYVVLWLAVMAIKGLCLLLAAGYRALRGAQVREWRADPERAARREAHAAQRAGRLEPRSALRHHEPRWYGRGAAVFAVLTVGGIIGINKAPPRSALSVAMGWVIGLSVVAAMVSLVLFAVARHRANGPE